MPEISRRPTRKIVHKVWIIRGDDQAIILPKDMKHKDAAEWIMKIHQREETEIETQHTVEAYPTEGAIAFNRALDEKFGFYQQVEKITQGFFGPDVEPPKTIFVKVGVGKRVSVPWGRVMVPNIEGYIETGFTLSNGRCVLSLKGKTKRKFEHLFDEVAELTQKYVLEDSIYRGKAIDYCFRSPDDDGFNPFEDCPQFINVAKTNPSDLIFAQDVFDQVDTSLFTPVRAIKAMREMKIPFKRGVLLIGDYGVGKSLCALVTAKLCEDAGITFIRVSPAYRLGEAIEFARSFQPCLVFCEDIDRAVTSGDRNVNIDELLNIIDGIDSKSTEIMVVLTSNNLGSIHEAMLRPGRLDAVVHVTAPDGDAVQRLIQLYGRGMVPKDADLVKVGELLQGHNPAIVREAVERAKLGQIRRCANGETKNGKLSAADLEIAARGLCTERNLVKESRKVVPSTSEKLAEVLGKNIGRAIALRVGNADARATPVE